MKRVLYSFIIILEMVAFSIQNDNKSEGINEILDQLIKQAEGNKDKAENAMQYEVKENSGNDSKIIYIKTHMIPNPPNITFSNITEESNDINKYNIDEKSKYDTVSEEIIVEVETQASNERREEPLNIPEFMKYHDDGQVTRSSYPDDYLDNDNMQLEHSLDSYNPVQNEPDLYSRYPEMIMHPNANRHLNSNNALVKEMAKDLLKNQDIMAPSPESDTDTSSGTSNDPFQNDQEFEMALSRLARPNKILDSGVDNTHTAKYYPIVQYGKHAFLDNFSENLATISLNNALKQNILYQNYLDNSRPPLDIPLGFSLPNYATQPQNVIRTVIHHEGAIVPPESQWQTGTKCCTY